MVNKQYDVIAEKLKVIAHAHRLCIVKTLIEFPCNVSKIQDCLSISQSSVSQHLAKLRAAGIVEGNRMGSEVCYKVVDAAVISIMDCLFDLKK